MKKLFMLFSVLVVMVVANEVLADTITVYKDASLNDLYRTTGTPPYSPPIPTWSGEFMLVPSAGLSWVLNYFSENTKNQIYKGSFSSFCLEMSEHITSGETYNAFINDRAINGGVPGIGDPVSIGTAWLFNQFRLGILEGYDYTPGTDRAISAAHLQHAIWWLENERNEPSGNPFVSLILSEFGSIENARKNNDKYPIMALNLYDLQGNLAQDFLVPIPEPATMLLLGSGLLGMAGYARRRFKK